MAAASLTTSYVSSTSTIPVVGPLTTAFTPPDYCTNVIKSYCILSTPISSFTSETTTLYSSGEPYTYCSYVERDLTCGSDGQATRASACFPNDADTTGVLVYSPGTGCPAGWETQSKNILSGKTTAVCCPSGYQEHENNQISSCTMSISYTDDATTVLSCSGGSEVVDTLTYTTSTSSAYSYTTSYPEYYSAWAQKILVVYPTTDEIVSRINNPISTESPGGTPQPPPPSPTPPNSKPGLGTGAIVGIVVGVVGALLLVGAFIFWRRRQRKHHHAPVPKGSPAGEHDALPEFVAGNHTSTGSAQMSAATSNGLFQPQPELKSPR
ncbi:hypothetical protein G6011_00288 [Alternaria panax]|uniref:Uncharacterized protein n=1 Tax=Alternaria panax TaxID=48097 RepID=A0AAD4IHY9_9PLEO|nr:hypothetical protein G6011_00288 [Alternaria panax]